MLNALRHQRFVHNILIVPRSSTPYGIRGSSTIRAIACYSVAVMVLNALRHQRFVHRAQRLTPYSIRGSSTVALYIRIMCSTPYGIRGSSTASLACQCSTPYGIRGSSTQSGFSQIIGACSVLNALRHQRFVPNTSTSHLKVLNALRHQRFVHCCAQRLTASEVRFVLNALRHQRFSTTRSS